MAACVAGLSKQKNLQPILQNLARSFIALFGPIFVALPIFAAVSRKTYKP
jgi:hypothetical protein